MKIAFANLALPATGTVVVGMTADCAMTPSAKGIDDKMSNGLTKALKAGRFKGAKGESLTLHAPAGTKLARVVVVGLGEAAALDALAWRDVGGRVVANLLIAADGDVSFMLDPVEALPARKSRQKWPMGRNFALSFLRAPHQGKERRQVELEDLPRPIEERRRP